jgi:hypothetical protein
MHDGQDIAFDKLVTDRNADEAEKAALQHQVFWGLIGGYRFEK